MSYNKRWIKFSIIFTFTIIYYVIIQFAHTVCHVAIQKTLVPAYIENYASFLSLIFLFAPVLIFIWHYGLQDIKTLFLSFWKKYWIYYLIYIIILYLIRKDIILGYYYIDFSMFGLHLQLSETASSAFIMAYLYQLFYSYISTLFFVILPNYFLFSISKRAKY